MTRYDKEFIDYQQTEAYKQYLESQLSSDSGSAPSHKKKKPTAVSALPSSSSHVKIPSWEDSEADQIPQVKLAPFILPRIELSLL
jgi:hypothetical protein